MAEVSIFNFTHDIPVFSKNNKCILLKKKYVELLFAIYNITYFANVTKGGVNVIPKLFFGEKHKISVSVNTD